MNSALQHLALSSNQTQQAHPQYQAQPRGRGRGRGNRNRTNYQKNQGYSQFAINHKFSNRLDHHNPFNILALWDFKDKRSHLGCHNNSSPINSFHQGTHSRTIILYKDSNFHHHLLLPTDSNAKRGTPTLTRDTAIGITAGLTGTMSTIITIAEIAGTQHLDTCGMLLSRTHAAVVLVGNIK